MWVGLDACVAGRNGKVLYDADDNLRRLSTLLPSSQPPSHTPSSSSTTTTATQTSMLSARPMQPLAISLPSSLPNSTSSSSHHTPALPASPGFLSPAPAPPSISLQTPSPQPSPLPAQMQHKQSDTADASQPQEQVSTHLSYLLLASSIFIDFCHSFAYTPLHLPPRPMASFPLSMQ